MEDNQTPTDYATAQDAINRLLRASGGNKAEQDALRVTTEGFSCPGCNGIGEGFEDDARMTLGGPEHFTREWKCRCCSGKGVHDTEAEANRHEEGGACCLPEPDEPERIPPEDLT